jgi:hypothetical protein
MWKIKIYKPPAWLIFKELQLITPVGSSSPVPLSPKNERYIPTILEFTEH